MPEGKAPTCVVFHRLVPDGSPPPLFRVGDESDFDVTVGMPPIPVDPIGPIQLTCRHAGTPGRMRLPARGLPGQLRRRNFAMDTDQLRGRLADLEKITNEEWLASLDERKRKELEFHDRDRDRKQERELDSDSYEKFYGNRKYYSAVEASRAYVREWIANHAPGKVFLDYACGNGGQAIWAARAGARLAIGIDISRTSVENAKRDAEQQGVSENTIFVQADAENTRLPDACIEVALCSGMLHHLDLSYAFPELRRILAPGGVILAGEALDYNPAIKLYRYLTPHMRTEWEKSHILSLADLRFARRFFEVGNVRFWHLLSVLAPHLGSRWLPMLTTIDKFLTKVPAIQLLAWIFTFELRKPASNSSSMKNGN